MNNQSNDDGFDKFMFLYNNKHITAIDIQNLNINQKKLIDIFLEYQFNLENLIKKIERTETSKTFLNPIDNIILDKVDNYLQKEDNYSIFLPDIRQLYDIISDPNHQYLIIELFNDNKLNISEAKTNPQDFLDLKKILLKRKSWFTTDQQKVNIENLNDNDFIAYQLWNEIYKYLKPHFKYDSPNNYENLYNPNEFNIKDDPNYYYKLVTVSNRYKLLVSQRDYEASGLQDKEFSYVLRITKAIPNSIIQFIDDLLKTGYIKSVAFQIDTYLVDKKITELYNPSLEHLENGGYFDTFYNKKFSRTKLYNCNYDQLWIKSDEESITFEELYSQNNINNENCITTQGIHLKYFTNEKGEYFIEHLDHEFFYYEPQEYEKRKTDQNQKGSAKPREKTFKIDASYIPFFINKEGKDICVLYEFVIKIFKHKDLINEYFNKLESK